ncbi:MAG: DinB family protein [Pyrinomonadaceae bacterium]
MTPVPVSRPEPGEYAPYYERYVSLVPETDLLPTLERQLAETLAVLRGVTEEQASSRYAPGKWSVKELLGHMSDTERIFAYRALRFARGDRTPLPGFEQDDYVRGGHFDSGAWAELVNEFEAVRRATLCLLRPLDEAAWSRRGVASEHEISVRALGYIIAGHERHHREILRARYL